MIPRLLLEDLQAPGDIEGGRGRDGGEGGKRRGGRRERERERWRERKRRTHCEQLHVILLLNNIRIESFQQIIEGREKKKEGRENEGNHECISVVPHLLQR